MTRKRYFTIVAFLSLLLLSVIISQQPAGLQWTKETLFGQAKLQATPDSFYQHRVDEIFVRYCVDCHNENKAKGKLRLDSFRQAVFGGRSGDVLGKNSTTSLLLARMQLPADNRLAMPPLGRKRQTKDELKVIQMWLDKGASGSLTRAAFATAPEKQKIIELNPYQPEQIAKKRAPFAKQVAKLQKKYPLNVQYLARTSHLIEITHISSAPAMTDQSFTELDRVLPVVARLNLRNAPVTDQSLPYILNMRSLTYINISGTALSAPSIQQLIHLPMLKRILVSERLLQELDLQKFQQAGIILESVYYENS
ncbi:c-type cytochrome domain-containing protein [Catenovulum sediminis]|uniref:C-type cytochrome domain-containing protein n=1 Tax=Catenovulum sediminis TaxID=1740262 RepID=A0ABV1RLG7_9ALTE|nr:c-type cytochrome domain-containing protein [Catenovulum sediminis]